MRQIGLNIIFPVILLLILLSTGYYSVFTYESPFFYLFPFYLIYFFVSAIIESKTYIREIEYSTDSGEFIFRISDFNIEREYSIQKGEAELEIFQYGLHTRTRNFYLQVRFNDKNSFRQYDYTPWSYSTMKETVRMLKDIKAV